MRNSREQIGLQQIKKRMLRMIYQRNIINHVESKTPSTRSRMLDKIQEIMLVQYDLIYFR